MKMRLVATLVGLAVGLALTGFGQEANPVDPEVRQQIEGYTSSITRHSTSTTLLLLRRYTHWTR